MATGAAVGTVAVNHAGEDNTSIALVARDLPWRQGDTYVLWATGQYSPTTAVGLFMVGMGGECRVQFNLPGSHNWGRFWVTRPGRPHAVVATS